MLNRIIKFLDEIDGLVMSYDKKYNIMSGGCCMVAAEVMKSLERFEDKTGIYIDRRLHVYTDFHVNRMNLKKIAGHGDVLHMTVVIDIDDWTYDVGMTDAILLRTRHEKWTETPLDGITSDYLFDVYGNSEWNDGWDKSRNKEFSDKMEKITDRYIKEIDTCLE